eukprot:scaffold527_cov368-Prasinococcus_capsulatus_cf.AAC.58
MANHGASNGNRALPLATQTNPSSPRGRVEQIRLGRGRHARAPSATTTMAAGPPIPPAGPGRSVNKTCSGDEIPQPAPAGGWALEAEPSRGRAAICGARCAAVPVRAAASPPEPRSSMRRWTPAQHRQPESGVALHHPQDLSREGQDPRSGPLQGLRVEVVVPVRGARARSAMGRGGHEHLPRAILLGFDGRGAPNGIDQRQGGSASARSSEYLCCDGAIATTNEEVLRSYGSIPRPPSKRGSVPSAKVCK